MSEPCRCEQYADGISSFVVQTRALVRVEAERDAAVAALGRVGRVLFEHSHADTCATELSPNAGYPCSCWRAGIYAALEATQ